MRRDVAGALGRRAGADEGRRAGFVSINIRFIWKRAAPAVSADKA